MCLLSVQKWLPSVRKWLLSRQYLTVTFAKKFTKKKIIFGNQSGPSDVCIVYRKYDVPTSYVGI